ncbi:UDP-glucuronic acid decarboxylase 1 [Sphaceloma murrayae]|uniref:UDP-glucuronic acid decarboxylase 1 n=1 Tax=Sphaceloma murrayae TaxID=2082308 RepID=A0A2K1QHG0_9PEZI|nr:UDP-glucuronic acid decarboxylase 1 [Sphaceloma murrayae]
MSSQNVFLLGPGYIGREVIDRLLENGFKVTTLVRRKDAVPELEKDGINTVMGSMDDKDVITEQTSKSDIVIHTASADHIESVEAVIDGIDQRANLGQPTIYIHTSGCSFLSDNSDGKYRSDLIYNDTRPEKLDERPDSASHRGIDLAIIKARQRLGTKAKIFIMLPPLIYGVARSGRLSIQTITMARFAIKHKYAGYVGGGKSVWGLVHVNDLSYGYLTMLQWLISSPPEVALEHPYFFCENGEELSWGEIAACIGQSLYDAKVLPDATPRQIPTEQYNDLFGPYSLVVIGQNARNRAERLRALGWKPKDLDAYAAFKKEELPVLLKETGEFSGYGRAAASGATG